MAEHPGSYPSPPSTLEDLGVDPPARPVEVVGRPAPAGGADRRQPRMVAAIGLALALGVAARFVTVSPMWLDEALTVNIARLSPGDLLEALRHDGAPPLYYLVLHGWMVVVGTGDMAVRALSGLMAVAALPLVWLAARRLMGGRSEESTRWVAWAAVLLLASSPFAIRYATEARMYSMVVLLVLAGFLAVDTVLGDTVQGDTVRGDAVRPRRSRWAAPVLGVVTGALLLTHYWSFYLVAAVAVLLALRCRDVDAARRHGARRAVSAMVVGSSLFLPWLPSFLEQVTATGTPWGGPPKVRSAFEIVLQFATGLTDTALPLGLLLYALVALGLLGSPAGRGPAGTTPTGTTSTGTDSTGTDSTGTDSTGIDSTGIDSTVTGTTIVLSLRGRPPGRTLAAVAGLTVVLAVSIGRITGSAFAIRYAAVVLPMVILLAALGTLTLAGTRAGPAVLVLAVVLGFVTAVPHLAGDRTSAGRVAAALRAEARPGDVVAYCPDQLGPAVSHALRSASTGGPAPELVQVTFPRGTGPEFVDWVGYEAANRAAATAPFARMLLDRAGPDRSVWVVWAPGYRTLDTKCQALVSDLGRARPTERRVLSVPTNTFERPGLVQFAPG